MMFCAKVLLSECITIGLQLKKMCYQVFPSGWLVNVDGVNECISNMVQISGKNEYFPYLLAFLLGSMSAVSQNSCLSWLDLVILWPKVMKNHGVSKIRVFLGLILAFLWLKVSKNHGVPKIRVFLGKIFWHFSGPK